LPSFSRTVYERKKRGLLPERDIIVIGGSAGALEALSAIVASLPHQLRASIFVVIHTSPAKESLLPRILRLHSRLGVSHPDDGQTIKRGQIYVAPPDLHMLLNNGEISLMHGPKENRSRPAIDPLFRSAAINYGARVIAVLLSGALDDGTAGIRAVQRTGGITIVQDPADAIYPSIPESAIQNNWIDHIVAAAEIGPLLRRLVEERASEEGGPVVPEDLAREVGIIKQEFESPQMIAAVNELGDLTMFTCPECQGALWELKDGELLRYRCHVGHAYSVDSLDAAQGEKLEAALWSALRALEERGALSRRMAKQAREREHHGLAERFERRADETDQHVESMRQILVADPDRTLVTS